MSKQMGLTIVLNLLGGLALFLYGMNMMSNNLEAAAGNRMKDILEKLTANRFLGVLVGAVITAIIQSSSATTVMVVGFVNAGLMSLNQAVWLIMGANIGTTITGQLVALDIGMYAPLLAFIGVAVIMFVKNKKAQHIGGIVAGLGVLFIGMGMMSDAMSPLRDMPGFVSLMTRFSNPLLGILAGAVFTALIQSSSASVGILQALAMSGVIGLDSGIYVLFGQNIGTCITAVLASIGTSANAKRATAIHLMFNVLGTCIFVLITMVTPFVEIMVGTSPDNVAAQIANTHTVFNITTTVLLLPFGTYLAKLATKLIPEKKLEGADLDEWFDDVVSSQRALGVASMVISELQSELNEMYVLAYRNVRAGFECLENGCEGGIDEIAEVEDRIDVMNRSLSRKISKVFTLDLNAEDAAKVKRMYKITTNIERIGDHAINLAEYAKTIKEKGFAFSQDAMEEIHTMKNSILEAMDRMVNVDEDAMMVILGEEVVFEQNIDDLTDQYRQNQMDRMRDHVCNPETSIFYSEILTDYERIGDHLLNIAEEYSGKRVK